MAPRLSCSVACGIFPGSGLEPVSPALAGRFLTTAPPGKSLGWVLKTGRVLLRGLGWGGHSNQHSKNLHDHQPQDKHCRGCVTKDDWGGR